MRKTPLFLLATLVLTVGCSAGPSVEGKWNVSGMKGLPPGSTCAATFSKPDKITLVMDMSQNMPTGKPLQIHADINGTYKIMGEIMDIHVDDVKFKTEGAPDNIKPMIEAEFGKVGDQIKTEVNKNGKQKMKWNGQDSFTLSGQSGEGETYTRAK